jgi:hypothetical protein
MKHFISSILVLAFIANAEVLRVDSVTVDSVWNSDSSWYDDNGIPVNRTARDLILSFVVVADTHDIVLVDSIKISMSLDSGQTWAPSPSPLRTIQLPSSYDLNRKLQTHLRVFGIDSNNVVFQVYVRGRPPISSISQSCGGPIHDPLSGINYTVPQTADSISCGLVILPSGSTLSGLPANDPYQFEAFMYIFNHEVEIFNGLGTWHQVADSMLVINFSSMFAGSYHDSVPLPDSLASLVPTQLHFRISQLDTIRLHFLGDTVTHELVAPDTLTFDKRDLLQLRPLFGTSVQDTTNPNIAYFENYYYTLSQDPRFSVQ